ncbi:MAG: glutaredoxin family protein [Planctomycetes bacterium]|jgi:glutaredoxin|nr:glutaredoxin family protein [Planctomycetota bacterium]MCL4729035.1 glutaredoxin family protein [Planctomycetota bacterium]
MDDPFAAIRSRLPGALEVYVSTFCWDCRRLKSFLADHNVPFTPVNISDDPAAAARLESETGKRGVPFVLVNGRVWVRGYHRELPGKFDPEVFVRELAAAL